MGFALGFFASDFFVLFLGGGGFFYFCEGFFFVCVFCLFW